MKICHWSACFSSKEMNKDSKFMTQVNKKIKIGIHLSYFCCWVIRNFLTTLFCFPNSTQTKSFLTGKVQFPWLIVMRAKLRSKFSVNWDRTDCILKMSFSNLKRSRFPDHSQFLTNLWRTLDLVYTNRLFGS